MFLIAFVFLTGLQPSAIRATVMTFIAGVGPLLGRRSHTPSALSVAALAMLALHPPTAFSIGFWLSVFAVFGLAVFFPLVARYLHCLIPRRMRKTKPGEVGTAGLADPLAMTMTAQATTVPITASVFSTLSAVSPLANLLVTPLVTVLVAGGVVTLCARSLLGPFADIPVIALCHIAELSVSIAGFCASLPYACLPMALDLAPSIVVMVLLAALIYRFWPQPTKKRIVWISAALGLFVVAMVTVTLLPVRAQLVMLDVGQGDALLVREGSSTVLIDTGKSDTMLLEALARHNVHALDAVIITHPDEDHSGALGALVGGVFVRHVYFAEGLHDVKPGEQVFSTARRLTGSEPQSFIHGDVIRLGNQLSLTVLWPEEPIAEGGNDESICLELKYDHEGDGLTDIRALLTGDLEKAELGLLLARMENTSFDILKVGHHGSRNALSPSLAERLQPDIALIGVGENNYYGHPTSDTLEALGEVGAKIFRTDQNGNIALYFDKLGVELRCDTISDV
ncbi:MAG TPA: hypothetical protein DEB24_05340 [Coriobacteriia bacterium]|nr:hypothetical protein [Coriobacteriia bacterium]